MLTCVLTVKLRTVRVTTSEHGIIRECGGGCRDTRTTSTELSGTAPVATLNVTETPVYPSRALEDCKFPSGTANLAVRSVLRREPPLADHLAMRALFRTPAAADLQSLGPRLCSPPACELPPCYGRPFRRSPSSRRPLSSSELILLLWNGRRRPLEREFLRLFFSVEAVSKPLFSLLKKRRRQCLCAP